MTETTATSLTAKLAAAAAAKTETTETATVTTAATTTATTVLASADIAPGTTSLDSGMYQEFKSHRPAQKVITSKGIKITFRNNRYFTRDDHEIAFLKEEIKAAPLMGISLGEVVTEQQKDPNKASLDAMKEKMRQELMEEFKAKYGKDFGTNSYHTGAAASGVTTSASLVADKQSNS